MAKSEMKSIRTSVSPEYNIIFIRITPTLKEVEKQMPGFDINIPSERSGKQISASVFDVVKTLQYNETHWTVESQNEDFLTLTLCRGNKG